MKNTTVSGFETFWKVENSVKKGSDSAIQIDLNSRWVPPATADAERIT